jgi:hypothetical protein
MGVLHHMECRSVRVHPLAPDVIRRLDAEMAHKSFVLPMVVDYHR